jgi:hypothetical protein
MMKGGLQILFRRLYKTIFDRGCKIFKANSG